MAQIELARNETPQFPLNLAFEQPLCLFLSVTTSDRYELATSHPYRRNSIPVAVHSRWEGRQVCQNVPRSWLISCPNCRSSITKWALACQVPTLLDLLFFSMADFFDWLTVFAIYRKGMLKVCHLYRDGISERKIMKQEGAASMLSFLCSMNRLNIFWLWVMIHSCCVLSRPSTLLAKMLAGRDFSITDSTGPSDRPHVLRTPQCLVASLWIALRPSADYFRQNLNSLMKKDVLYPAHSWASSPLKI